MNIDTFNYLLLLLFYFFQNYCIKSVFDIAIYDKNFVKIL